MRDLVLVRAGDHSLHEDYTGPGREFDVFVQYYGETEGRFEATSTHYERASADGLRGKAALAEALLRRPHLLQEYDQFWLPDDDVTATQEAVHALFSVHRSLTGIGIGLSQPALSQDSYYSYPATLHHPGIAVRMVGYVEIMAPLFSRRALEACLPTFSLNRSGWGVDWAWQAVIAHLGLQSAIIDCVQVRHTRPVGGGDYYRGLAVNPLDDLSEITWKFGFPPAQPMVPELVLDEAFCAIPPLEGMARVLHSWPVSRVQGPTNDAWHRDSVVEAMAHLERQLAGDELSSADAPLHPDLRALRVSAIISGVEGACATDVGADPGQDWVFEAHVALSRQSWMAPRLQLAVVRCAPAERRRAIAAVMTGPAPLLAHTAAPISVADPKGAGFPLSAMLEIDVAGHYAKGRLLAAKLDEAADSGSALRIGVTSTCASLSAVLAMTEGTDAVHVVVFAPPGTDLGSVAAELQSLCAAHGIDADHLSVEVKTSVGDVRRDRSIDAYIDLAPAIHRADQPLPLTQHELALVLGTRSIRTGAGSTR